MKYEHTKAQQHRRNDGYKKSAKREAAKMSRRHGKKLVVAAVVLSGCVSSVPPQDYKITVTTHCDTCDGGIKTVDMP